MGLAPRVFRRPLANVNYSSDYQAEGYAEHRSPPPFNEQELAEQQSERSTHGDADTGNSGAKGAVRLLA